ncbi:hypothetical protein CK203_010692 [Vitis vinifera]|uniref:Organ-specific protein S2 n=1 Tax=Vitis vinifera TaxID=29760 RepID=A0A438JTN5_VITVI|nr:hypothetical protein CK203_010692 [Vitis vinifera]
MKSIVLILVSISLLLLVGIIDGRESPGEYYWKGMMKDQPMPEAVKELVDDPDFSFVSQENCHTSCSGARERDHFVKDFDSRPNGIIYHGHVEPKEG